MVVLQTELRFIAIRCDLSFELSKVRRSTAWPKDRLASIWPSCGIPRNLVMTLSKHVASRHKMLVKGLSSRHVTQCTVQSRGRFRFKLNKAKKNEKKKTQLQNLLSLFLEPGPMGGSPQVLVKGGALGCGAP